MRFGELRAQSSATTCHSKIRSILTISLLVVAAAGICAAQTRRRTPPPTITSVKAMLFYDNTGTFSEDVAEDPSDNFTVPSILWNTPMEGTSRKGASTSLFVTVEIDTKDAPRHDRSVELTVRYKRIDGSRQLVERRTHLIREREAGKYVAGFWIYEAGCNRLYLTARIPKQAGSTVKKIVRFGCGE